MVSWLESKRLLCMYLMIVITAMLYMGLKDDIPSENQVRYSVADNALFFGERGLAYSKQTISHSMINRLNTSGFEVRLTFSPLSFVKHNFQFLMLLSNGNAAEQFVIAQVRDYIIVMNGDDYNYRQKKPRLRIKITEPNRGYQQLKLTVTSGTTVLSLNGKKKVKKATKIFNLPNSELGVRLLLSGSELLENNWHGAISSFSVLPLEPMPGFEKIKFDASLENALDNVANSWLYIPSEVALLKHRLFGNESFNLYSGSALKDIVLNFLGFAPFGFLIAALMFKIPVSFKHELSRFGLLLAATFLCGFLLSFIIEYRQAWLITRHSSLRDLYLNALGGVFGAIMYVVYVQLLALLDFSKKE